jgi:hypothetical protein
MVILPEKNQQLYKIINSSKNFSIWTYWLDIVLEFFPSNNAQRDTALSTLVWLGLKVYYTEIKIVKST